MNGCKRSRMSEPTTKNVQSLAQQLPSSILAHMMQFVLHFRDLARTASVCRNWNSLSQAQQNVPWRALYMHHFEPESCEDDCILSNKDGLATPWKSRYSRRAQVERNWSHGRGHVTHTVDVGDSVASQYMLLRCSSTHIVLADASSGCGAIHVYDLNGKAAAADESKALGAYPNHDYPILDLQIDGNRLATCDAEGPVRISNMDSGQVTHSIAGSEKVMKLLFHGNYVVGTDYGGHIEAWDIGSNNNETKSLWKLPFSWGDDVAVNWAANRMIVARKLDYIFEVYDFQTAKFRTKFHTSKHGHSFHLALCQRSQRLFACNGWDNLYEIKYLNDKISLDRLPNDDRHKYFLRLGAVGQYDLEPLHLSPLTPNFWYNRPRCGDSTFRKLVCVTKTGPESHGFEIIDFA